LFDASDEGTAFESVETGGALVDGVELDTEVAAGFGEGVGCGDGCCSCA
jgi:hypothetical protein